MTIIGVGIDLLHLPRIHSLFMRRDIGRFASRVLSNEEMSAWIKLGQNERVRFVSNR
jgi:holo-[acyl-carrier protein] synthase